MRRHVDDRREAVAQRELSHALNDSPSLLAQRKRIEAIENSPRTAAQRLELGRTHGPTIQLNGEEEKTPQVSGPQSDAANFLFEMSARGQGIDKILFRAVYLHCLGQPVIDELLRSEKGKLLLEQMVLRIGDKGSTGHRDFGMKAIQKRFGITKVTGHSGSGIRTIYGAIKKAPEHHVSSSTNRSFSSLTRPAKQKGVAGNYSANKHTQGGTVEVHYNSRSDRSLLEWATLHEIGHSVDHALGLMQARKSEKQFDGPWTEEDPTNVSPEMLRAYEAEGGPVTDRVKLTVALTRTVAGDDSSDTRGLSEKEKELLSKAKWGRAAGRWNESDSDQRRHAVNGRVFYVGNKDWTTRPLERTNKVSTFQYSTSAEWFAEIYANYFSGNPKGNPPINAWFKTQIADKRDLNPQDIAAPPAPAPAPADAPGVGLRA